MESYGYGLLGYNMMMAALKHCLFHHNYWRRQVDSNIHSNHQKNNLSGVVGGPGGNAVFRFTLCSSILHFHKNATGTLNILA